MIDRPVKRGPQGELLRYGALEVEEPVRSSWLLVAIAVAVVALAVWSRL